MIATLHRNYGYRGHTTAYGLHPWYVHCVFDWLEEDVDSDYRVMKSVGLLTNRLEIQLQSHPDAAIGEAGLDKLYCVLSESKEKSELATIKSKPTRDHLSLQKEVFKAQFLLAVKYGRGLVVHCVRSYGDLSEILVSEKVWYF